MLQLGNVLVRLEEFEEAESLFESALGIATWDQIKLIKTSRLRLYERFAQSILSKSSEDDELLIEILTKGNKLASSMLQQIDTDKAGSTAVIRFVGIMVQAWRVNLDRGIADVSQELELLLNELVPIVTNYGEQLYRNVNQNRLTYLSSQLRRTPWDSLLEVVLAIPQTNELIGQVGMLNLEKNFGFINSENERFVFFSRSFSIKSDFDLCKVGSRVRFEISAEKPSGENRIAKEITIL
jgi:cold shock CspA family protein